MINKSSVIITHYADKNSMLSYYTPTECWENLFKLLKLYGSLYDIISECEYIVIDNNRYEDYGIEIHKKKRVYHKYHYYKIRMNYIKIDYRTHTDTRISNTLVSGKISINDTRLRHSTILQYLLNVYSLIVEVIMNQHELSAHEMQICNVVYKLVVQK